MISSIADSYGLYNLNKKYSEINQFYYDENEVSKLIIDYQKFYFKPNLPEITLENGKLIFKSQVYNEECNKNAIFYTNLYSNKTKENVSVIMIHGWRSEKLNRLEPVFLNEFKKSNIIYIDIFYLIIWIDLINQIIVENIFIVPILVEH